MKEWSPVTLPNDKFLGWPKMIAFEHEKDESKLKIVFGRIENTLGKGEKAVTIVFPRCSKVFVFIKCATWQYYKLFSKITNYPILEWSTLKAFVDDKCE